MSDYDKNLKRMVTHLPLYHEKKIRFIAGARKIAMTRLIAFAVDNELQKDRPFDFDLTLPNDEYIEYAYADEAGKILNFIKTLRTGIALDNLTLLRFKIGIPSKKVFLAAFRECIEKEMLEPFKPFRSDRMPPVADDYYSYRLKNASKVDKKLIKKQKDYAKYLRLKKEFGKDGELDE